MRKKFKKYCVTIKDYDGEKFGKTLTFMAPVMPHGWSGAYFGPTKQRRIAAGKAFRWLKNFWLPKHPELATKLMWPESNHLRFCVKECGTPRGKGIHTVYLVSDLQDETEFGK